MLEHPVEARTAINTEMEKLTGKPLVDEVLSAAWSRMRPTWDPIAPSLVESANAAYAAGFLNEAPDLSGIYDLSALNSVLRTKHLPEIELHN
jgi:NitT/TauT family transport system substrate-binding protein